MNLIFGLCMRQSAKCQRGTQADWQNIQANIQEVSKAGAGFDHRRSSVDNLSGVYTLPDFESQNQAISGSTTISTYSPFRWRKLTEGDLTRKSPSFPLFNTLSMPV
jgi:hypothetical protein